MAVQSKPTSEPRSTSRNTPRKPKSGAKAADESAPEDDVPPPATGKGRKQGVKNITDEERSHFLDIVEQLMPTYPAAWDNVYAAYNEVYPNQQRAVRTLRGLWQSLTTGPPPTGNPPMAELVKRALELDRLISLTTETKTLDDSEVPPPTFNNGHDEEQGLSDEDGSQLSREAKKNGDTAVWVPTEDEEDEPKAPASSKKVTILVPGSPKNDSKPSPKPKALPRPIANPPPFVATPARTTASGSKVSASSSGLSIKLKVKAEPGSTAKAKGKGKATPSFPILELTSSDSDAGPVVPKRKAKAEEVDNSRLVRRKPELNTSAVRTTASCTRQNAETVVNHMLKTFDPAIAQQTAELQQAHTRENITLFDYQQQVQSLQLQLAEANRRVQDEREKYFNARLELNQAQMMLSMNSRFGFGGSGASMVGVPSFGAMPAAFGGSPVGYPQAPALQANPISLPHPSVANTSSNVSQPVVQQPGEALGAYNQVLQPGAPGALAPAVPAVPGGPPQAPAPASTSNAENIAGPSN
ncbi:hypothetical protein FRC07_003194 [Ceratobasidium sp. 392]|nr:hypothetical protein FRC07_003194 [Ceratobasidium sp. 392]